jgi:uncharacterized protein YjeT (DUF2065 family)
MKSAVVFGAAAVLSVLFGLSFLFAPATSLALYGIEAPTTAHQYSLQWFGMMLVSMGVVDWLVRDVADTDARRAVVTGNLLASLMGVALGLIGVLQGIVGPFGWSTVGIYGALALAFAWMQFGRHAADARAPA